MLDTSRDKSCLGPEDTGDNPPGHYYESPSTLVAQDHNGGAFILGIAVLGGLVFLIFQLYLDLFDLRDRMINFIGPGVPCGYPRYSTGQQKFLRDALVRGDFR